MSDFDPSEYVTIPDGWTSKRLADCTIDGSISYGIVQPGQHDDGGVPVIRVNNVNNGQLDLVDVLKVSPEIESKYARTRLLGGEVLLTLVGSTGQSFVAPKELAGWNVPRAIAVIRADEKVGAKWINICLQSKETMHFLNVRANTTVQKTLNLKDVRDIPILIPPSEVKESIENMALTLSEKIELNRQTNQTLEQIAQAIFKSWFVDFEPTRAKLKAKQAGQDPERAAMAAISGKTLDELDQLAPEQLEQLKTTAALFPDALVDSALGEVPEGWGVKNIEEISTNVSMGPFGSNIKVDTFVAEGIPIINGQQLKGMMLEDGENKFITHDHADKLIKSNVYRDDIVITHRGTLGQVSIIPEGSQYDRYIVSQSQCYIRPNKMLVSPLFLIFYFRSYIGQHELLAHKSQVGVPSIAKPVTNIRKIELVVPRKELSDEFQRFVNSLQVKISENLNEVNSLKGIRDALLPRLLSGEVSTGLTEAD